GDRRERRQVRRRRTLGQQTLLHFGGERQIAPEPLLLDDATREPAILDHQRELRRAHRQRQSLRAAVLRALRRRTDDQQAEDLVLGPQRGREPDTERLQPIDFLTAIRSRLLGPPRQRVEITGRQRKRRAVDRQAADEKPVGRQRDLRRRVNRDADRAPV